MGNPKQKWSIEEESALRAGVGRYGPGKWKMILADPDFSNVLASRSNVDLKDKWRNMGFSASGQGSRERVKTPKFNAHPCMSSPYSEIPFPLPAAQDASTSMAMDSEIPSPLPAAQDASTSMAMDPSMSPAYGKINHRYTAMTFEALPTKKDLNESDINSLMRFIEIENCYKIKLDGVRGENTSVVEKQKDHQKPSQANAVKTIGDEIQETAKVAADMVGDAEYKKFMANVAGKTVDRVAKLAHDSDSLLQLVEHIFERCSNGEVVFMK